MSVHVITDSASDAASREGLTVLPMTVSFGEEEFQDGVTISHEEFYHRLDPKKPLPVTSQITPFQFLNAITPHREAGEEVVIVTMSSKLSGTYQSALAAAAGDPKVFVVDSLSVAPTQRVFVEQARHRALQGRSGLEIFQELEEMRSRTHLVAVMDTLEYLKKGGRISKTVALAGGLLGVKPMVATQDGQVAVLGKPRGSRQGCQMMIRHIQDMGGVDFTRPWFLAYTGLDASIAEPFLEAAEPVLWPGRRPAVVSAGAAIGTHIGPGTVCLGWVSPK